MTPDAHAFLTNDQPQRLKPGKLLAGRSWAWRLSLFAMAVVTAYMTVSFLSLNARLHQMRRDATDLQTALTQRQTQNQALQKEVQELQTDAYVEKVAREDLQMTKPGEIRYLTKPQEQMPDSQATSRPAP